MGNVLYGAAGLEDYYAWKHVTSDIGEMVVWINVHRGSSAKGEYQVDRDFCRAEDWQTPDLITTVPKSVMELMVF